MNHFEASAMGFILKLQKFIADRKAIAAMEFALTVPLLLLLGFGGFETSRYVLIQQKTDKVAYIVADIVAQNTSSTLTLAQINGIFAAAAQVMNPFAFNVNGYVIVNSILQTGPNPPNNPQLAWQYTGGGTMTSSSQIGTAGGNATLPAGMVLNDKDNVIVVEVFYQYTPLFAAGYISPKIFYRTAIFKPRLGSLTTKPA
jgi:hypothetical protein